MINNIDDLIELLGYTDTTIDTSTNTLALENSNDYQYVFDLLLNDESFKLDENSIVYDEDKNESTFFSKNLTIHLVADFDNDKYRVYLQESGK